MSLLTGKNGMLNSESIAEAAKGKVIYVDVDNISGNDLNRYELQDIDELAENIREKGLLEPLQGIKNDDGSITLLSGHRRYAAIMNLIRDREFIRYAGKVLDNELPVIVKQVEDPLEQRVLIMSYNAHRTMNQEERRRIILEAHEVYEESCKEGKRPTGREREWITSVTGISDGTVGKVLADLNREKEPEIYAEKDTTSENVTKSANEYKKVTKAFRSASASIPLIQDLINEGMDPVDYRELKDLIKGLKADLERMLPNFPVFGDTDFPRIYLAWNGEICNFAERGDQEAVISLLKEKNHEMGKTNDDNYSWMVQGGKFHFMDKSTGKEITIPLKRFASMLIERAKYMNGGGI